MIALGGHYGQPGSDPELLAFAEWIVLTNQETREKLATDWHRQDTALRELFEANNALFEALQAQQASTRRRVVVEMGGLVIVAIGTVLSTLPTSAAGG